MFQSLSDDKVNLIRTILIWTAPTVGFGLAILLALFNGEASARTSAKAKELKGKLEAAEARVEAVDSRTAPRVIDLEKSDKFWAHVSATHAVWTQVTVRDSSAESRAFGLQIQKLLLASGLKTVEELPEKLFIGLSDEITVTSAGEESRPLAENITRGFQAMGFQAVRREMGDPDFGVTIIVGPKR